MEFEEKDYGSARNQADSIKSTAENISGIFNNIDRAMKALYGESWQSSGADVSQGRYAELKSNYDKFYQNVLNVHKYIYDMTAANEAADAQVSSQINS